MSKLYKTLKNAEKQAEQMTRFPEELHIAVPVEGGFHVVLASEHAAAQAKKAKKSPRNSDTREVITLTYLGEDDQYVKVSTPVGIMRLAKSRVEVCEKADDHVTVSMSTRYALHRNLIAA